MGTIENIYKYLDFKGVSVNQFSKDIGVSNSYFSKQKASDGSIGSKILHEIVKKYEDINPEWLLTGKGSMLRREETQHTPTAIPTGYGQGIPLIPYDAIGGFGKTDIDSMEGYEIEGYYDIPEFRNNGADFMVRVKGSSMYPKYSSGDVLACKRVYEVLFFQWNKVYVVFSRSQGYMVKRIKKGSTEDTIMCVSDNPNYEPFEIPKSDIVHISLVVGAVKLE